MRKKKRTSEKEIIAIDAETDPFERGVKPEPFIWGAYNGHEYWEFENVDELVDFLSVRDCTVYAHNGGKFDYHFLLHRLESYQNIMVIGGRLAKFTIGNAEFRDSYNILPAPLRAFNKEEIEYWKMKKEHRQKYMAEIQDYLYWDCYYLWGVIDEYIKTYGKHLTFASSALKQWEKIDGKTEQTNENFYNSFQPYYYGGRVECFSNGVIRGDINIADINSAYPYAMTHDHATGSNYIIHNEMPRRMEQSFIRLRAKSWGAFPFRTKDGLFFPNDGIEREYTVTGWELKTALATSTAEIVSIVETIEFAKRINFTPYVSHFFKLKDDAKKAGDNTKYQFAKFFLNSLYGKFAANPEKYNEFQLMEMADVMAAGEEGWEFSNELQGRALMQKPLPDYKRVYYNLATAASVTGFVRAMLWEAICGTDKPLYCDTDSVFFTGNHKLPLSAKLGDWDIEGHGSEMAIAGKKLYSVKLDNGKFKNASKGVRLSEKDIFKIANGETVLHENIAPNYSIKRGVNFIDRNVKTTYKEFENAKTLFQN